MKDNLINAIQKFLNTPFYYSALIVMLDKQKDFLLQKNILDKADDCEYNALWDTICYLENHFAFAKEPNWIIGCEISISKLYNNYYNQRRNLNPLV